MIQKIIPRNYSALFLGALFFILPSASYAANCHSNDAEMIAQMYDVYVNAGKEPYVKKPKVLTVEPAVAMTGEVIALNNFEKCWFERPACNMPADYRPVHIDASISYEVLKKQYNLDTKAVIYECFMKIGASYKYKYKYNQRR